MLEKLEKVLDLLIEGLEMLVAEGKRQSAANGGVGEPAPAPAPAKPARAPRKTATKEPEKAAEPDPFAGLGGGPVEAAAVSVEDQMEAKRICQDLMAAYIRRVGVAGGVGLGKAKVILAEVCGRPIAALEELKYADHVKLTPRFERELDALNK